MCPVPSAPPAVCPPVDESVMGRWLCCLAPSHHSGSPLPSFSASLLWVVVTHSQRAASLAPLVPGLAPGHSGGLSTHGFWLKLFQAHFVHFLPRLESPFIPPRTLGSLH